MISYTQGVNSYIESLSYKDYPLEYKLLDYAPERWTILKSALLLKYMANNLSGWDADLEYTNALKTFGREIFDQLYPDTQPYQEPVVRKEKWDFTPISIDTPNITYSFDTAKVQEIQKPHPDNGSNNWAVSGKKTANRNPILCNDPHLGLNLPSIWYLMQLSTPTHRVKGATLPGAPCVIVGFNDHIAWGVTNARRDVMDWYKIQFKDASREEYLIDSTWKKTQKVVESIKIRNGMVFYDTVCYTSWGPVVFDATYKSEESARGGYALRWIAHDPSKELLTFYLLNRAKNYADYRQALTHYDCPAQNFVFASTEGDIAITVQGKFPIKWKEQGKFALDGTRSDHRWQNFIPDEHNVYDLNPQRGFVSSANQHPTDMNYPYYQFDASYEYFRNRRINALLDSMNNITVEDMMRLQNDNYDLQAAEALPYLLAYLSDSSIIELPKEINENRVVPSRIVKKGKPTISLSEEEKKAYDLLCQWNYQADKDLVAPSYFNAWYDAFFNMTWDEIIESKTKMQKPEKAHTFRLLRENPTFSFFDRLSTPEKETAKELVRLSFKEAVSNVEKWKKEKNKEAKWADFRNTRAVHLARIPAFSTKALQTGGNRHVINANSGGHGVSWRMVVELDRKGVKAWGVYPGGQSGNVGSKYFHNFINHWEKGTYYRLDLLNSNEESGLIGKQKFKN
ncbi:MAG: penicillin acylase family protein [Flammeovirgaceae bacterium]